jgi:hypothetical protein
MSKDKKKLDFSQVTFKVSLILGVFLLGGILAQSGVYPFNFIDKGITATKTLIEEQTRTHPELLERITYPGEGVTINETEQTSKGFTLMQGWFPEGPQAILVDMDGTVVHRWKIDFFKIWPNPQHIYPEKNIPQTPFNYHSQGIVALPDGSIVANIGNTGTVKLDKCNQVVWTVDRMTHHSVTLTEEGGFWILANNDVRKIPENLMFAGLTLEKLKDTLGRYENLLLYVDANGQVQKEFSILQAIVDAGLEHQLFNTMMLKEADPTHANDIEVVTPELAAKIQDVNEGDLLVSIRQLHMLAIFDQKTGKIKWYQEGPWVRQHDPDITPEGNIVVFNNRYKPVSVRQKPGSNILEYNPATGETQVLYPGPNDKEFYSKILGTQQALSDGNWLINESRAGRVFEINQDGHIVWEFIQAFNKDYASLIEVAERYSYDYFTVDDWTCPNN